VFRNAPPVVLFAPAWSTIIECVFFGRKLTLQSTLGLVLSFIGIVVIFRGELPLHGLGALGDWLALLAGISWSTGSALMFSSRKISIASMTTASFLGALIVASFCVLFFGQLSPTDTQTSELSSSFQSTNAVIGVLTNNWQKLLLVFVLLGFFYLVPVSAITLWGATQIPPALMSFLLTLEIIAAVASSAVLLGERFGLIELLGTALIISGALAEFVRVNDRK